MGESKSMSYHIYVYSPLFHLTSFHHGKKQIYELSSTRIYLLLFHLTSFHHGKINKFMSYHMYTHCCSTSLRFNSNSMVWYDRPSQEIYEITACVHHRGTRYDSGARHLAVQVLNDGFREARVGLHLLLVHAHPDHLRERHVLREVRVHRCAFHRMKKEEKKKANVTINENNKNNKKK